MASVSIQKPPSKMQPYKLQKIGVVYGRYLIYGRFTSHGDNLPRYRYIWWAGGYWEQSMEVTPSYGYAKVGDLYEWQRIFTNTSIITKYKQARGSGPNADNRFYDETLDEILGGVKQTLGL